jgi:uncharacterized protein
MLRSLKRRGLKAAGIPDKSVYHLVGRETRNPSHPREKQFSLVFSDLSLYAVKEILDLSGPQEERFLKAFDATKLALERLKIFPANDRDKRLLAPR